MRQLGARPVRFCLCLRTAHLQGAGPESQTSQDERKGLQGGRLFARTGRDWRASGALGSMMVAMGVTHNAGTPVGARDRVRGRKAAHSAAARAGYAVGCLLVRSAGRSRVHDPECAFRCAAPLRAGAASLQGVSCPCYLILNNLAVQEAMVKLEQTALALGDSCLSLSAQLADRERASQAVQSAALSAKAQEIVQLQVVCPVCSLSPEC
jgi:hypothetical protein